MGLRGGLRPRFTGLRQASVGNCGVDLGGEPGEDAVVFQFLDPCGQFRVFLLRGGEHGGGNVLGGVRIGGLQCRNLGILFGQGHGKRLAVRELLKLRQHGVFRRIGGKAEQSAQLVGKLFLHRKIVLCPRGDGGHAVKGGIVCQGRAFQFKHGPGFRIKSENGRNVTILVSLDERAGGVRPLDRGIQTVRLHLQRLDPASSRGGFAILGGVHGLVLVVHHKRRLARLPTGNYGGGNSGGDGPRLDFDALERTGPSVAGGKFAHREKLDASGRGAARIGQNAGGDGGGVCGTHDVRIAGLWNRAS